MSKNNFNSQSLPTKTGLLYKQSGKGKKWEKKYLVLKDEYLYYYKTEKDKKPQGEILLQGATIKNNPDSQREYSFLVLPEGSLLEWMSSSKKGSFWILAAETEEEKDQWFSLIEREIKKHNVAKTIFGAPLKDVISRRKDGVLVPEILEKSINYLRDPKNAALEIEGIFRLSGSNAEISYLIGEFNDLKNVDLKSVRDIHSITGLIKAYLRELPDPLLTGESYDELRNIIYNTEESEKLSKLKNLLDKLPKENYHTLEFLFGFLKEIVAHEEKNKMGIANVAKIFGPNLISRKNVTSLQIAEDSSFQDLICRYLLIHSDEFFKKKEVENINEEQKEYAEAMHQFDSQHPNQMSISKGDIIEVIAKNPNGWWYGSLNGLKGYFPSNYTKPFEADEIPKEKEQLPNPTINVTKPTSANEEMKRYLEKFQSNNTSSFKQDLDSLLNLMVNQIQDLQSELEKERKARFELETQLKQLYQN